MKNWARGIESKSLPREKKKDVLEVLAVRLKVAHGSPKNYKNPSSLIKLWLTSPTNGVALLWWLNLNAETGARMCSELSKVLNSDTLVMQGQNVPHHASTVVLQIWHIQCWGSNSHCGPQGFVLMYPCPSSKKIYCIPPNTACLSGEPHKLCKMEKYQHMMKFLLISPL